MNKEGTIEVNAAHFEYAESCGAYWQSESALTATMETKDLYISELQRKGESEEFVKGATYIIDALIEAQRAITAKAKGENERCKEALRTSIKG